MGLFNTSFNEWGEDEIARATGLLEQAGQLNTPNGMNRLQLAGLLGDERQGGNPSLMALKTNDRILSSILGTAPGATMQNPVGEWLSDGSYKTGPSYADRVLGGSAYDRPNIQPVSPPIEYIPPTRVSSEGYAPQGFARQPSLGDQINANPDLLASYWDKNPDKLSGWLNSLIDPSGTAIAQNMTPENLQAYWDTNPTAKYQAASAGYLPAPMTNWEAWQYMDKEADPELMGTKLFAQQITDHLKEYQRTATIKEIDRWFDGVSTLFSNDPKGFQEWELQNPEMAIRFHAQADARHDTDTSLWGEGFNHGDRAKAFAYQMSQDAGYGPDAKNDGKIFAPDYDSVHNLNSPDKPEDFWKIGTPQTFSSLQDSLQNNAPEILATIAASYFINPVVGGALGGYFSGGDIESVVKGAALAFLGGEAAKYAADFVNAGDYLNAAWQGAVSATAQGALDGDLTVESVLGSAILAGGAVAVEEGWDFLKSLGATTEEATVALNQAGASSKDIAKVALNDSDVSFDELGVSGRETNFLDGRLEDVPVEGLTDPVTGRPMRPLESNLPPLDSPTPNTDSLEYIVPNADITGGALDTDLDDLFSGEFGTGNPDIFAFDNYVPDSWGIVEQIYPDEPWREFTLDNGEKIPVVNTNKEQQWLTGKLSPQQQEWVKDNGFNFVEQDNGTTVLTNSYSDGRGANIGLDPAGDVIYGTGELDDPSTSIPLYRPDPVTPDPVTPPETPPVIPEPPLVPQKQPESPASAGDPSPFDGQTGENIQAEILREQQALSEILSKTPEIQIEGSATASQVSEIASQLPNFDAAGVAGLLNDLGIFTPETPAIKPDNELVSPSGQTAGQRVKAISAAIASDPSLIAKYFPSVDPGQTEGQKTKAITAAIAADPSLIQDALDDLFGGNPGNPNGPGDPGDPNDGGGGGGSGGGDGGGDGGGGGTGNTPITDGLLSKYTSAGVAPIEAVYAAQLAAQPDYVAALRMLSQ